MFQFPGELGHPGLLVKIARKLGPGVVTVLVQSVQIKIVWEMTKRVLQLHALVKTVKVKTIFS